MMLTPTALDANQFPDFFHAAYGYDPFPWQARLAEHVLTHGDWPSGIDIPTGAGKTACIDIAVFALACEANRPASQRRMPRRIFFVVDRRVIVDEAFERAARLANTLDSASDGILAEIANNLRVIAGRSADDSTAALAAVQLRGGVYRDDHWVRDPVQATVLASTVDQIGSRLLYRGYGLRGGFVAPIHAGMVGNDALIILDEAHCANPFMQTLAGIKKYRQWGDSDTPQAPFLSTILSATPPSTVENVFRIDDLDLANATLRPRLTATKLATLQRVTKAKGKKASLELAKACVAAAREFVSNDDRNPAIGIIVNRVRTAQEVFDALATLNNIDRVLLTGRMRSLDKDGVVEHWLRALRPSTEPRNLARPLIVVATQTLEVGANLDFDALISECAAIDALRQRFGRLNRAGRDEVTPARILARDDQLDLDKNGDAKQPDPIYGHALARSWEWLGGDRAEVDFGILAMNMRIDEDAGLRTALLARLTASSPDAMLLTDAHLDLLVQTSPEPEPSPDISRYLHGGNTDTATVMVCWRADLDAHEDRAHQDRAWQEAVTHCPPTAAECMPVPLAVLRAWFKGATLDGGDSDVEANEVPVEGRPNRTQTLPYLRWLGPEHDGTRVEDKPNRIRPGDTLVLPVRHGGWNQLGHIPQSACIDQAEHAAFLLRRKVVLRLHPALVAEWPDSLTIETRTYFETLATQPLQDTAPERGELKQQLQNLQREAPDHWCSQAAAMLLKTGWKTLPHPSDHGWILATTRAVRRNEIPKQWLKAHSIADRAGLDFSDEDSASSATVAVPLHTHLDGVGTWATHFSQALGLPNALSADLTLAARLHDLGKADPRFQAMLHGGNPWLARLSGQLLAKGEHLPRSREPLLRGHSNSLYPRGGRHELLSVRLAESNPELLASAHDPDLVLHLIASHHGRCRCFAPHIQDDAPLDVSIEFDGLSLSANSATDLARLDSGVSERFWQLVRRYGWWGLAWLEAILRLADWNRSAQEQTEAENRMVTDTTEEAA